MGDKKPKDAGDHALNALAVGCLLVLLMQVASAAPCTNVASWWTFNNTIVDKCGTNDLVHKNGLPVNYTNGAFNSSFEGVGQNNDNLEDLNTNGLPTSNQTFCAWFRVYEFKDRGVDSDNVLFQNRGAKNGNLIYATQAGVFHFWFTDADNDRADASFTGVVNKTYHACAVWNDTDNTNYLYVNGTFNNSVQNNAVGAIDVNTNVYVMSNSLHNRETRGWIDELVVFDKRLSETEINNLFLLNSIAPGAITVDFTPHITVVNESQQYTPSVANNITAVNNWWWFMNNNGTLDYTAESPTHTYTTVGQHQVYLVANISGVNYTRTKNVTVAQRPTPSFTVLTSPPFAGTPTQFNSTSNGHGYNITNWYWSYGDGSTASGAPSPSHTYTEPGIYTVNLTVQNNLSMNSSAPATADITVNGFWLSVYNEVGGAALTQWNLTLSNGTTTVTHLNQNNSFTWYNFTGIPTGQVTITLNRAGFLQRKYMVQYSSGHYVHLNAYLLDTVSGVFPTFNVITASSEPIEDALITAFATINGTQQTVSQAYTDTLGLAQMYLNPSTNYLIMVTKAGYNPHTLSVTPIATTYIITLTTNQTLPFFYANNTFFIWIEPTAPVLNVGNDNVTVTINDGGGNLLYWNVSIRNGTGFTLASHASLNGFGGYYTVNSSAFAGTVAVGSLVHIAVTYDRNGSNPYNSTVMWHTHNYTNYSVASIFATTQLSSPLNNQEFKELVSVGITLLTGVAVGAFSVGTMGAIAMAAVAGMFTAGGWLPWQWFSIMLLFAITAYMFTLRGGGGAP